MQIYVISLKAFCGSATCKLSFCFQMLVDSNDTYFQLQLNGIRFDLLKMVNDYETQVTRKEEWVLCMVWYHDNVIKWKHFARYWPFVRGIHRSPVNSPHKGQRRGALVFSLICARINGWANNREAGDLRRHQAHCDVIVMPSEHQLISPWTKWTPFLGRRHFKCIILNETDRILIEICSHESNWQKSSIGTGNGLEPNRRQAISWTSADPIHWRIYLALRGDGFN